VTPFIGRNPCEHVEEKRDREVGRHHIDPDSEGEGREEGEQVRVLLDGFRVQDGDAQVHERHREVHTLREIVRIVIETDFCVRAILCYQDYNVFNERLRQNQQKTVSPGNSKFHHS